ncbi:PITH domain-containing protein GA19395-like isoform X3 [Tubulanus polymorphus]|uniref:PITH domain-containing protein GA19395-like isoform X3 n=1 Tax=Tubulanus polymorphus TaxID=672921 RepID=UPI003DA4A2AC
MKLERVPENMCLNPGKIGSKLTSLLKAIVMKNYCLIFRKLKHNLGRYAEVLNPSENPYRFTGCVKLKGVIVIGDEDGTHPSEMRLFKNRPHMTFDDCQSKADQTFELNPDKTGQLEYNPKIVKFSSVQHLTIHFPKNFGSETTKIYYIGLKGDFTQAQREGVVICNYEARANPADHKTNLMDNVSHQIQ